MGFAGTVETVPLLCWREQCALNCFDQDFILPLHYDTSTWLSEIVLDIHRGDTADYAAGWEPYLVWFTRFQEKPALALPHLRWPPLLPR